MFDDLTEDDWQALIEPLQEEWPALTDDELEDLPREWQVLLDRIVELHDEPEDEAGIGRGHIRIPSQVTRFFSRRGSTSGTAESSAWV